MAAWDRGAADETRESRDSARFCRGSFGRPLRRAANADEAPTRIFHVGIVTGSPRTSDERVAFEDRLRELGYVEGRNLAIDYVHYDSLDHGAAAVGEMAQRRFDVLLVGGQTRWRRATSPVFHIPAET